MKNLADLMAALPPARRRKIAARAATLIAEEQHRQARRKARAEARALKLIAEAAKLVPWMPMHELVLRRRPLSKRAVDKRQAQLAPPLSPALKAARDAFYAITGGSIDSGNVRAARVTTEQRIKFFRSKTFRDWVAYEKLCGREVFWLKDVDKTQGAGDIFTFFYKWRAENDKFSKSQLVRISKYLKSVSHENSGHPMEVLRLFEQKLAGGEGLGLMDFWSGAYWPAQFGFTRAEKKRQVEAFARHYAARVYPGVKEENKVLEEAGVHVVIVSNGDQELAIAVAKELGIKSENVVGSNLLYAKNNRATGVVHSYEITGDHAWESRPQPGKALSFHYWLHMNRQRFGWDHIDDDKFVIAGRDGDSASSDGGMMILLKPPAIGNFMVDTPGEPERLEKFFKVAAKYGWTKGQFFTLVQEPSQRGATPSK
jgi:hypothetical protein